MAKQQNGIFYFVEHSCEMQNDESKWAEVEKQLMLLSSDTGTQWIDVADIIKHLKQKEY